MSVKELGNVRAVYPYCTLSWNLFAVDDDLYFTAVTQEPSPPGEELSMSPDYAYWLLCAKGSELQQLWPAT